MMINRLIESSLIGACVVVGAEVLRTKKHISNESSRKLLHIAHGLVVACWAFIIGYNFIIGAEILFLIVVLLARKLNIMQPLRSVKRKSWGDIFFPLGVIAIAFIAPSRWVFLAAMLHLGLADAAAALVGSKFKKGEYYVFGQRKTLAGSGTFLIVSLVIIYWLVNFSHAGFMPPQPHFALLFIPLMTTLTENYSVYGSDNLTIPLVTVMCLNLLSA